LITGKLYKNGPDKSDRLLIVVHHLAVDGISWRIILEDTISLYNQLNKGESPKLPQSQLLLENGAES
jgi:NRPS condensation-like uncharacterized protein